MTEQDVPHIGAWLRRAREESGVSLRQIADTTKLSTRTLDALERNRVSQLPGGIYRRAIVRSYAANIGLDPEATLRAFLAQHPDDLPAPLASPAPLAEPAPRHRFLPLIVSVLSALIPILAGVFYFTLSARGADGVTADAAATPLVARQDRSADRSSLAVLISVSAGSRLQVIADGRVVVARPVAAGESFHVALGQEIVIVGDDAGAVHVSINGRAGRALGATGAPLTIRIPRDDYEAWLIAP